MTGERERARERERERRDSAHDVYIMYIYKGMWHFPANFKGILKGCRNLLFENSHKIYRL